MSIKTPSPSIFRPEGGVDQSVLKEHKALIEEIDRRKLLRGAVSLGALTMLTGCNVTHTDAVQSVLKRDLAVQRQGPGADVPAEPSGADVLRSRRSSSRRASTPTTTSRTSRRSTCATWKLELAGLIEDKRSWTAQQIYALPEQEWIIRHICVEGWDYIGQWSGVNLRQFLERIGADLKAKYVSFKCADDYYGIDRHGDRAASADDPGDEIRQGADHRSVRLSAAAAHRDQARLQEPEVDHRDRGHQRLSAAATGKTAASTGSAGFRRGPAQRRAPAAGTSWRSSRPR